MHTNSTKTFSWRLAVIVSLGLGLLAFGLSASLQTRVLAAKVVPGEAPLPAATTTVAASGASGAGHSFEAPIRLVIPAIGVDAHIQSVGLSWRGDGDMSIPTNFTDVGWYNQGPLPGMPGSAVIDGHLDGKDVREAVFYNLDKLTPGDIVEVRGKGGKTLEFRVIETKIYDYNATTTEIFSSGGPSRLNLITCAGSWDKKQKLYDKRIVVFTELVSKKQDI